MERKPQRAVLNQRGVDREHLHMQQYQRRGASVEAFKSNDAQQSHRLRGGNREGTKRTQLLHQIYHPVQFSSP